MSLIKGETIYTFQQIQLRFQRFWEGIVRNFTPSDDNYLLSGVQPYQGGASFITIVIDR